MGQLHLYVNGIGPRGEIAELRAYLRQRDRLLEYAASHIQHMQKALTEMNLQLHHVVADITGATGLRIIRAILATSAIRSSWQACGISAAAPVLRRSPRHSPAITAPSTCSPSSRRSR